LILSNSGNTYTGTNAGTLNANGTQIAGGILGITSDTSLGLAPAGPYNNIQFTGSSTLRDVSGNISLNINRNIGVASTATATFDDNGNLFTINGVINGSGAVAKTGAGTTTFANTANSYAGKTTISTGTLNVSKLANGGSNSSIGSSSNAATNLVINGATLQYSGSGDSTDRLFQLGTGTSTLVSSGAGAVNFTNTGTIVFGGTSARTFALSGVNTGTNTFAPLLTDPGAGNSLTLTKSGASTWVLTNANTYSGGTNVSAGTLLINGNQSGATGAVVVGNGGTTLGGTGTIGGATSIGFSARITGGTAGSGGTIVAGNIGALTLSSSLTFNGSSGSPGTYLVDIGSGANNSDRLNIGGALNLTTAFDQILFNGTPDGTSSYILATYASRSGTFDLGSAPSGYTLVYGATELDLVPIPEPSTWAAGALALAATGYSQRSRLRRRRS
jgi:fibronectin-binding autotransporter adhesin